jgi:pyruvate dehydrogenase E2 component (dihydrolipoamide acetyltransferase)
MISEVVMPQMGADMQEGTILRWLKREGDAVQRGEIIAEIETDKANVEIEAYESGVLRRILLSEGATVPVGQIMAVIAAPEDDVSQYAPAAAAAEAPTPAAKPQRPAAVAGAPPIAEGRIHASPAARRLAEELGVDVSLVRGTGPDGRILRRDIEAAKAPAAAPARPAGGPVAEAAPAVATPAGAPAAAPAMSRMRQAIARRMAQSKREAPHYYLTMDIDMTEAQRLRQQLNEAAEGEAHVSVNDMIVKAVAKALRRHPTFNSWFVDGQVQSFPEGEAINIGVAVALEEGLIAPAVLDCGRKSLADIALASRDLAERARSGVLKAEEYTGATFTVSNLGMYGVETLIAIISPPQTAILGVGVVKKAPVVRDGEIVVGERMKVALSADHRVTDGAQGARFLADIRNFMEKPITLLV